MCTCLLLPWILTFRNSLQNLNYSILYIWLLVIVDWRFSRMSCWMSRDLEWWMALDFFFIFLQNFATAFCLKVNWTFMIQIKTKQSKKQQEAADNIQAALCPKAWRICTKVLWATNWQWHISSASKKTLNIWLGVLDSGTCLAVHSFIFFWFFFLVFKGIHNCLSTWGHF